MTTRRQFLTAFGAAAIVAPYIKIEVLDKLYLPPTFDDIMNDWQVAIMRDMLSRTRKIQFVGPENINNLLINSL